MMFKKMFLCLISVLTILLMTSCAAAPDAGGMNNAPAFDAEVGNEEYNEIKENNFVDAAKTPLSSFSLDSSTYSYPNLRRLINEGSVINKDAVVIEHMLNYFHYDYVNETEEALNTTLELATCPWNSDHYLASIAVKAKDYELEEKANNFVFLIDTSGSMSSDNKLGLFQQSFNLLMSELGQNDTISIVTYASGVKVLIDGMNGSEKGKLLDTVLNLRASGSTNGSGGIQTAYELATKNFIEGGNNRVLLATDGDFNVGLTGDQLKNFIAEKRESGVYLSVFGYGIGNTKHNTMENLAQNGNGNAYYIDSLLEAKKVFVSELGGTMQTVAKDCKAQVEFNPAAVKSYRLLGYENKQLTEDEFEDSQTDAGEIGASHTTIAMYEIIPNENFLNSEFIYKAILRYKEPLTLEAKEVVNELKTPVVHNENDFQFASCVIEFALLLRDSEFKGNANYDNLLSRLNQLTLSDYFEQEFKQLVQIVKNKNAQ